MLNSNGFAMGIPQVLGANSATVVKGNSNTNANGVAISFIPSVTGTIALYDSATAQTSTGNILAATAVTAGVALNLGLLFFNGLYVVLAGGAAGTIVTQ